MLSRQQRRLNVAGQGDASLSAPESYRQRLIGLSKELRTAQASMRTRMAASSRSRSAGYVRKFDYKSNLYIDYDMNMY